MAEFMFPNVAYRATVYRTGICRQGPFLITDFSLNARPEIQISKKTMNEDSFCRRGNYISTLNALYDFQAFSLA